MGQAHGSLNLEQEIQKGERSTLPAGGGDRWPCAFSSFSQAWFSSLSGNSVRLTVLSSVP